MRFFADNFFSGFPRLLWLYLLLLQLNQVHAVFPTGLYQITQDPMLIAKRLPLMPQQRQGKNYGCAQNSRQSRLKTPSVYFSRASPKTRPTTLRPAIWGKTLIITNPGTYHDVANSAGEFWIVFQQVLLVARSANPLISVHKLTLKKALRGVVIPGVLRNICEQLQQQGGRCH